MGVQEKDILPVAETTEPPRKSNWRWKVPFAILGLLVLSAPWCHHGMSAVSLSSEKVKACDQAPYLMPESFDVSSVVKGQKDRIVTWLSDAVKVPTEIFDVMGEIGEDKRWDVFYKFADYLEKAFPLTHEHLTRTRVMTHALVYEWKGSDESLKPLLLTAHQDVVPVLPETRKLWTHEPYGGEFDGKLIWGRGSMDDKSGLIGMMSAVELLIESGKFKPERTVIMAFGTDEETGGKVGAYNLGQWIEAKYGKDSMAMLIDEGGGMQDVFGQAFALPAVAEKGYLDVELQVLTKGGHSSVPPEHTGIGLASLAIAELEKNPYKPYLNVDSPLVSFTQCAARWASDAPSHLVKDIDRVSRSIAKGKVDKCALKKVQDWWTKDAKGRALVSTTQAVDIINAGMKINALPEVVTAYVNHRISIASSVDEVQSRMTHTLKPIAKDHNLNFEAFGKKVIDEKDSAGTLVISTAWNSTLNPAPVSPFTIESPAWRVLSGTIRGVYASREGAGKEEIYMAPLMSTGNTDTKRYWNLTRNIYRYAHLTFTGTLNNAHTVDEHIDADIFVEQVRWFANFIVNVDESREDF